VIERISLEQFSLKNEGPTLSLTIRGGQSLAVAGPAASGKSQLLNAIGGESRPARGAARIHGDIRKAGSHSYSKRAKVHSLLTAKEGRTADEASSLVAALGLWESRTKNIGDLSPSQLVAVEIAEALLSGAEVVLLDGHLDRIDPWALPQLLTWIRSRHELTAVAATNRADILSQFDLIVVLRAFQVRFAGSPADLLRLGPKTELVISTRNQDAVKALVEPFEVSLRQEGNLVHLEASEAQDLAARLLLDGYGDVKFLVMREPTLAEALESL